MSACAHPKQYSVGNIVDKDVLVAVASSKVWSLKRSSIKRPGTAPEVTVNSPQSSRRQPFR